MMRHLLQILCGYIAQWLHFQITSNYMVRPYLNAPYVMWNQSSLTLSQCTLAGPVYTGMPLGCHWLTQCTLGYHWATQRILAGYTGTPLEKLSWNSPTLDCHWRNLVESAPHWDATGETLTFEAYTGGTVTSHTRPDTYSWACKVASIPV